MKKYMIIISAIAAFFITLFTYSTLCLLNDFIFEYKNNIPIIVLVSSVIWVATFKFSMRELKKSDERPKNQLQNSINTKVKNYYKQNSNFQKKIYESFGKR